jgi:Mg2+ and Co2+ transporter CorA
MNILYYRFHDKNIEQIVENIPPQKWIDEVDWVEIHYNNRKEVYDFLSFLPFIKKKREMLLHPETHPLPATDNKYILQNFVISKKDNFYDPDYVSLIVTADLIINIIPLSNDLVTYKTQPEHLKEQFTDLRFYFAYALGAEIFNQSIANMGNARKRLRKMEKVLIGKPEKLTSIQVMETLNDIARLVDIVEDQYVGFGMFSSFLINEDKEQDKKKLKEVLDSFAELNRLVVRLEEKAESFRYQFMLIHQENSARRINILTIIQAIFVPLTFLAGVYGMNFENMPELGWHYAYYVVLGIFFTLAGTLLIFFKKNGWFD